MLEDTEGRYPRGEGPPETAKTDNSDPDFRENLEAAEEEEGELAGLARLLQGASYPATKEDLADYAADQGADDYVLQILDQLPDTTYNNPADVSQALGENAG